MFFEVGNCRCGQGERRWDDHSGAQNEGLIGTCTSLALRGREGGQGLACVEGHRGRVCFPCGGGSRLGCVALGKVL